MVGGGDDDVWFLGEGDGLGLYVCVFGDEDCFEGVRGGDGFDLFEDLEGEFIVSWN